jgi:hypothetical protein
MKRHLYIKYSRFWCLTSNLDLYIAVMTSSDIWAVFLCHVWIPRSKNPMKIHQKSNTVDFNDWPPVDLQMVVLTSSDIWLAFYCQIWIPRCKKKLWKDTHRSTTVSFNDWPPVDLQLWPPNGSYDLQWHLSSILVTDMDSLIQKTYEKTPISPI